MPTGDGEHDQGEGAARGAQLSDFASLARPYEPERFLAATLARGDEQVALAVLAAFAADLSRIVSTATQPLLGEIRLQWWRDSLDAASKGNRIGAPLADAVADVMRRYDVPLPMLFAMTEARAFDLYDDPMPDDAALDGYLGKTEAIPFELGLRVLGMPPGDASALSRPAGRAFGLTRLLAGLPDALAHGRLVLPVSRLAPYGLSAEALLQGDKSAAVDRFIAVTITEILAIMASLQPQISALPRRMRVAVLPLAVVKPYLSAVGDPRRNPVRDVVEMPPLKRVWRMTLAHLAGRI